MHDRYLRYIARPGRYYDLPEGEVNADSFRLVIPDGWNEVVDEEWVSLLPVECELQPQGWKVHVSSRPEASEDVLMLTSKFCFANGIAFKYTPTVRQLMLKNSKSGNRVACGKFITIYPPEAKLEFTLVSLNEILASHRDAPYILSDRRFSSGPLYYRYGGFQRITNIKGELCIVSPDGALEPDLRVPYYKTPDWVRTPDFLQQNYLLNEPDTSSEDFRGFSIESALHFSTGGGIYKAIKDSKAFVIKEGRPFCGLDASGRDAVTRIRREAEILRALDSIEGVPHFVDEFDVWEHHYLAETFHGQFTFGRWLSLNYPFNRNASEEQVRDYLEQLDSLATQLVHTICQLHSLGISHGDIQPHNILVDPDNLTTTVIDFETAVWDSEPFSLSIGTPGYIDSIDDPLRERDWVGLYRTIRGAILAISPVESLASSKSKEFVEWIETEFGKKGTSILEKVSLAAKKDGVDVTSPKSTLVESRVPDFTNHDEAIKAIFNSLCAELDFTRSSLAPGDAYQFEGTARRYCLAYGGAGIWKALIEFSSAPEEYSHQLDLWLNDVESNLDEILNSDFSMGLFSGISGIVDLAIHADRHELAEMLAKIVSSFIRKTPAETFPNISIESGYAGMILMLMDFYQKSQKNFALEAAAEALDKCRELVSAKLVHFDVEATHTGLLYGWTGVALAAYKLYEVTLDDQYLSFGDQCLEIELSRMTTDGDFTSLLTDDGRLMPYFSLGSAGVALVVRLRKQFGNCTQNFDFPGAIEAMRARPCAHAGLFKGVAGLLGCLIEISSSKIHINEQVLRYAKLYLVQEQDTGRIFAPGDFSYRFSLDLATGLAGWLFAISGRISKLFPGLSEGYNK